MLFGQEESLVWETIQHTDVVFAEPSTSISSFNMRHNTILIVTKQRSEVENKTVINHPELKRIMQKRLLWWHLEVRNSLHFAVAKKPAVLRLFGICWVKGSKGSGLD